MYKFKWLLVFLYPLFFCHAQNSLLQELSTTGIPDKYFTPAELRARVEGAGASNGPLIYYVYMHRKGDILAGNPHVLLYDSQKRTLTRTEIRLPAKDDEYCCGSPDGIRFFHGYLALAFHLNPSISSTLILDNRLKVVRKLLGDPPLEIAPGLLVYTEGVVHFAPAQKDRFEAVDLHKEKARELFPLADDTLRNDFIQKHKDLIPENCTELSEENICRPESFEESFQVLATNNSGSFAAFSTREVDLLPMNGLPKGHLVGASLYVYRYAQSGWTYCALPLTKSEADAFANPKAQKPRFSEVARCNPNQPVTASAVDDEIHFDEF